MPFEMVEDAFIEELYGKRAKVSTIQRLFAQLLGKITQALCFEINMKEYEAILTKMETEVNALMSKGKSVESKKLLAIKGFIYIQRGYQPSFDGKRKKVKIEHLKTALDIFGSIKNDREGIFYYIVALQGIALHHKGLSHRIEYLDSLKFAECAFDMFQNNFSDVDKEAWNATKLFDITPKTLKSSPLGGFNQKLSHLNNETMAQLYYCAKILNIPNLMLKLEYINGSIWKKTSANPAMEIDFCNLTHEIAAEIEDLIGLRYFGQVDHFLTGLWYQMNKYQRASDEKKMVRSRAIVSMMYAKWANQSVDHGGQWRNSQPCATINPIKTKIHRFEQFAAVGVKLCEQELPLAVVKTANEVAGVVKKGKFWGQKALKYFDEAEDQRNVQRVKDLIRELDQLQNQYKGKDN
ncbi:uncharacterized protein LOC134832325 [Culicoides brevitarsis]|uniref:uncharacterized protein LOC134832325 n=1 Tax=Culicoides brevitarsis TaxID=469753 RepID=UPI00307BDFCB